MAKETPTAAESQVMLALLDSDAHGYAVMQRVAEQSEGRIQIGPGTLYTAIARLIERGWIEESPHRPESGDDDARRRYYRLTKNGRQMLEAEARHWARLASIAKRRFATGVQ